MNTLPNLHNSSPARPLIPSTAGIRVVMLESDETVRDTVRAAIQRESTLRLAGEAQDWSYCDYLLQELVPELLIAQMKNVPDYWWHTAETNSFPLLLALGETHSLMPVDERIIQTLTLPLDQIEVQLALLRAQTEIYTRKAHELSYLLRQYTASSVAPSMYLATIPVEHEGKKFNLDTRSIAVVMANANYCRLHTESGVYEIRETMNNLCSKLDPSLFTRIHRSAIVNTSRVREVAVSNSAATRVVLQDGTELPVGPNFREAVNDLSVRKRA